MITYQQEFLLTVEKDIKPLLEEHWLEVATNKHAIKLNPDWEAYHTLEDQGMLHIFTAREGDTLVGYFVTISRKHIHYKDHMFAVNSALYLKKAYRKGFISARLFKFAEKSLKEDGVSVLIVSTTNNKPFDKLLLWLGYKSVETMYSKLLGD